MVGRRGGSKWLEWRHIMGLRQTKPWLDEDDKLYWQQTCRRCVSCEEVGFGGRFACLRTGSVRSLPGSPCPKFERSDLTEREILTGIGVKVEGRP